MSKMLAIAVANIHLRVVTIVSVDRWIVGCANNMCWSHAEVTFLVESRWNAQRPRVKSLRMGDSLYSVAVTECCSSRDKTYTHPS